MKFIFIATIFYFIYSTILASDISYDWTKHKSEAPETLVHILDSRVLNELEENGYSFSETLSHGKKASRTSEIFNVNSYYRDFTNQIGQNIKHDPKTDQLPETIPANLGDIPELVRLLRDFEDKGKRSEKDLTSGYIIRKLSNNSKYPYSVEYDGDEPRHFDQRWLNSKFGYFKLVAVVNRMDRIDFYPETCGEVRFIYRLSYKSPNSSSSLPFFVNVVHQYPKKESCSEFAKNWLINFAQSKKLTTDNLKAPTLFANEIKKTAFKNLSFKQLELNFQSLRFTSGYMHDFGGQAMYILRVFRATNNKLIPVKLENTPNVLAIEKQPELLNEFVAYLKKDDNLQKLDQGTLVIDFNPKFLTEQAISWSTLGRARSANKPYSRLFKNKKELLESIDISKLNYIKSYAGLVERLDNSTCVGCHQSSGTAGFHILGFADPKFSHHFNRQELPLSGHAFAESFRRKHYITNLAKSIKPNTFKPHSNFPKAEWLDSDKIPIFDGLKTGALCLLNTTSFSNAPKCASNSTCSTTVGKNSKFDPVLFGECTNNIKPLAGSTCWQGTIVENINLPKDRGIIPSYNFFAFQDKFNLKGAVKTNPSYKCVLPQSGAPLGRSSRACTKSEEEFSNLNLANLSTHKKFPAEICGNQGGNGFDLCAATGDSGACLEARVVRSMLDTCHSDRFCREDYICQRIPDYNKISEAHYTNKKLGKTVNLSTPSQIHEAEIKLAHQNNVGFCVPTYFLFNMRLDGHPSPVTGLPPGTPKIDRTLPLRGYIK